MGHVPWLDEWQIKAGDSIPNKVSRGIDECDYLLVLLSPISVGSGWVEREWSTKYWTEVESGEICVIPVLLEDCAVPALLRTKKYADFRADYASGLEQIVDSLLN
ncbi:toll/interleukin-1 receptor domain-containing protein [Amycolatopsis sp. cg9]|uniref:toll/interleukin-1 receptor domain-containing protein n=1 Tax=Amycolatopsis sp. cg9 TaxID=3238801 RepID=UPI00352507F7